MNEEYLWNRSGEADPEIARLERLLAPLQYQADASRLREVATTNTAPATRRAWWWAGGLTAAAMLLVAVLFGLRFRAPGPSGDSMWSVSWNDSTPHRVRRGEIIETGKHSAARLESDFVGEVRVDPESRVQLMRSTKDGQTFALKHGTIHAFIWAPPREFVVDTPSAKTIDLGCRYTLQVTPGGIGSLHVEMGWVAFQWHGLESFIPAGAACTTWPGRGPGTPHFADAPAELRAALAQFDKDRDAKALRVVLERARPRDALTLWHLLSRTQGSERAEVFAHFSKLVKLPSSVTKERIASGDPAALDGAWNALDLGNTDWWREWKRKW